MLCGFLPLGVPKSETVAVTHGVARVELFHFSSGGMCCSAPCCSMSLLVPDSASFSGGRQEGSLKGSRSLCGPFNSWLSLLLRSSLSLFSNPQQGSDPTLLPHSESLWAVPLVGQGRQCSKPSGMFMVRNGA